MRKDVCGMMLALFVIGMLTLAFDIQPVKAETIVVPDDYLTIQEAINTANPGDTVYVKAGTYYGNVIVDRTIQLIGESPYSTIIDGGGTGHVVHVKADNVVIKNLTIRNSGWPYSGIYLGVFAVNITRNNNISGNNITNNEDGIRLDWSSYNNSLSGNVMADNRYNFGVSGTLLSHFIHDIDVSNTVDDKPVYYWVNKQDMTVPPVAGYVALVSSTRITVQNLNLANNYCGILLVDSSKNTISGNTMANNVFGIRLVDSSKNTISGNNITANSWSGILFVDSLNNNISGNNITNNEDGIRLDWSSYNTISGNNITNNEGGIRLTGSSNNSLFHNNFVNNTAHAYVTPGYINNWDDGYPSGGNYWSDYNGTDLFSGPYQNETGSDGIGDTPYQIDVDNQDRYPLMAPINIFGVGTWDGVAYNVDVVSNSTVSNFQLDVAQRIVRFGVAGVEDTAGFCRVTIPNVIVQDLWKGNYTVLLNGELWPFRNWTEAEDTYIYINYTHHEHEITIIPEIPSAMILLLFMALTMLAVAFAKKRFARKLKT